MEAQISQPVDFSKYLFRCSGLGRIMANPKAKHPQVKYNEAMFALETLREECEAIRKLPQAKKEQIGNSKKLASLEKKEAEFAAMKQPPANYIHLSKGVKKFLIECYVEFVYGRTQELESRYIKKGNATEDEGIALIGEVDGSFYGFYEKERKYDEFMTGECDLDVEEKDAIYDNKSSWDLFSFQKNALYEDAEDEEDDTRDVNKMYFLQGQGYMHLYNRNHYYLCYTLNNTPKDIVEDTKRSLAFKMGKGDGKNTEWGLEKSAAYEQGCSEIDLNSNFDDIPAISRVIKIHFERDDAVIEEIKERIILCRRWLNQYAQAEFIRTRGNIAIEYRMKRNEDVQKVDMAPTQRLVEEIKLKSELSEAGVNLNLGRINSDEDLTNAKELVKSVLSETLTDVVSDSQKPAKEIIPAIEFTPKAVPVDLEDSIAEVKAEEDVKQKVQNIFTRKLAELEAKEHPAKVIPTGVEIEKTGALSEYENLLQEIEKQPNVDAVRSLFQQYSKDGKLEKYTELRGILETKRDSFNIPKDEPRKTVAEEKSTQAPVVSTPVVSAMIDDDDDEIPTQQFLTEVDGVEVDLYPLLIACKTEKEVREFGMKHIDYYKKNNIFKELLSRIGSDRTIKPLI